MPLAGIAAENQVDTIADKNYRYPFNMLPSILAKLVSNAFEEYAVERIRRTELIVDSQAQKIAEQAKEIERLTASANQAKSFCRHCGGESGGYHPCPYSQEIHDCDDECNCCEECTQECRGAI